MAPDAAMHSAGQACTSHAALGAVAARAHGGSVRTAARPHAAQPPACAFQARPQSLGRAPAGVCGLCVHVGRRSCLAQRPMCSACAPGGSAHAAARPCGTQPPACAPRARLQGPWAPPWSWAGRRRRLQVTEHITLGTLGTSGHGGAQWAHLWPPWALHGAMQQGVGLYR